MIYILALIFGTYCCYLGYPITTLEYWCFALMFILAYFLGKKD